MRLLVINEFARYLNGGASRVVVETLEGLHRRGCTVGCIHHMFESELSPDIWTRRIEAPQPVAALRSEMLAAIAEFRPDVIQSHSWQAIASYPAWVPHYAACQFIHDASWYCSGGNRFDRTLASCHRPHGLACLAWHVLKGCNGRSPLGNFSRWQDTQRRQIIREFPHMRLQVASRFMARGLRENGYPESRVDVIPLYSSIPAPPEEAVEPGLVVYPTRLVAHKGVHVLIEALSQLRDLRWRLVVPGEGPDRPTLIRLIERLGVADQVEMPGELHPLGVAGWYARAQIVAFPVLRDEPFGLVGPEAMAHGKPIVAFAGGAVEEWLVPGETGLRVESKTAGALAAALRELLQNPSRCLTMGAAALGRHANFTLEAYLDRLIPSLERVRETGPKARA